MRLSVLDFWPAEEDAMDYWVIEDDSLYVKFDAIEVAADRLWFCLNGKRIVSLPKGGDTVEVRGKAEVRAEPV